VVVDATQDEHERAVADRFIEWYNSRHDTAHEFYSRGAGPPDFVYRDGSCEMLIEVTAAYYDATNATMLWQNARGVPGAAQSWMSKEPDRKLIDSINATLQKKCGKPYPEGCVLLVALYPDITSAEEFEHLRSGIHIPPTMPFAEIYVAGVFPASSGGSRGGYCCWKLA
jgi:hypothetical protein